MDVEAHQYLHDEQRSDCRSFGNNVPPSSQSRKISMGVMAESKVSTCGAMKGDQAIVPITEREISNAGNLIGEKNKVEGVTASFNIKQIVGSKAVKYPWISKSFYQRKPTSEDILQSKQACNLLVAAGGQDKADGIGCAAGKKPVQLFSNRTSFFLSSNYNQKKSDGETSRSKGRNDGTNERAEEFAFATAQEAFESDKTKPEDKINTTENSTEDLRMKLCQILRTASSPKIQHSGSQSRNRGEENLRFEQHLNQKDNKVMKTRQNSADTIETDSENHDHTRKRPVTRSLSRKRAPSKKQPAKGKNGLSSKDTESYREKSIFPFGEKWIGRRDAFPNDASSLSLKKNGPGKISRIGAHKICSTENDTSDKLRQGTLKMDLPLHDEATCSLGNKMGGLTGCSPEHQTKCPQTKKINQEAEICQPPTANNTDQHREINVPENGNQPEYRSDPVVQYVAKSPDDFQSPTFQLKTPNINSSPSSTPKTEQKANGVSSPASTDRRFSLGTIHNLLTFQNSEADFNGLGEQRQSSDVEELDYSVPRKDTSFMEDKEEDQDGSSDSSSEERNLLGSQQGSRIRHASERTSFTLHPFKRLCKNEGIKFNDRSPASVSSKGRTSHHTSFSDMLF